MKMSESNEIASTWLDVKESTECFDAIELLYYSHSSAAPEQQYTRSTTNYRQQNESNDASNSNSSRSRRSCSSNKNTVNSLCVSECVYGVHRLYLRSHREEQRSATSTTTTATTTTMMALPALLIFLSSRLCVF